MDDNLVIKVSCLDFHT